MKTKLLALVLLAGSSMFARTHVFFGVGIGGGYAPGYYAAPLPPPPPPVVAYVPPSPGYGYTWVDGYWYPVGPRYHWRAGYWARPAFVGSYWVRPRYHERRYYPGYWRR